VFLENSKRNSPLLSISYTQNNVGYANKFRRSYSQQNSQSESKSDNGRKGSSKIKLLMIGFGFGAVIGLSYWYNKNVRNKMIPIANVDSENKLLFLEPPPVDFIAKKVFEKKCYIISDCFVFFFFFCKIFFCR
jgi:hypothetical protein